MREKRLHIAAEQGRLKELPPKVWLLILLEAPRTAIYCPCFSEFSALDWVELLKRHPQLAEFCEDFTLFLCDQITSIILSQPELLCCFPKTEQYSSRQDFPFQQPAHCQFSSTLTPLIS